MGFSTAQLAIGANYTLETYRRVDPMDQVNYAHEVLRWLIANKEASVFGNGLHNEPVYISNDGNYQNYFGADAVTYNERDPARWAKYAYYNNHVGFWFDEDRLAANGIIIDDSNPDNTASQAEKELLLNLLKTSYDAAKKDQQEGMAFEYLLDGSANPKATPGLDFLVSTAPTVGSPGGLPASAPWWQNNASLAINTGTPGNLTAAMELQYQACMRYGGMPPNAIFGGQAFVNAYRKELTQTISRTVMNGGTLKGGVTMDGAVTDISFRGIPVIWDPTFEALDAKVGVITTPWTKRCYFLNSNLIKLRPLKGAWMVNRKPRRLPDRYVHYFGSTSKGGMTTNKRNGMAVLSIA